jgi:hypothetical protein
MMIPWLNFRRVRGLARPFAVARQGFAANFGKGFGIAAFYGR